MRLSAKPIWPAVLAVLLLTSCGAPVALESAPARTESFDTACRELARDFPEWYEDDPPERLENGARFVLVFEAACPGALAQSGSGPQ